MLTNVKYLVKWLSSSMILIVVASWFSTESCIYNSDKQCPMANGESLYEAEKKAKEGKEHFAAAWDYPFGRKVKVCTESKRDCQVFVIKDRGPARRLGRGIDLNKYGFEKLAPLKKGLIKVTVEEL